MFIFADTPVQVPVFQMSFVQIDNTRGILSPRVQREDDNDRKVEAWKQREREQARQELFSKIKDTRFSV